MNILIYYQYINIFFKGGNFILRIPAGVWKMVLSNNGFYGIQISPTPQPNPDGSYTVTLTPEQFGIFQNNQANPPQLPSEPAAPAQQSAAPEQPEITASKDPSMSFLWYIDVLLSILEFNCGIICLLRNVNSTILFSHI